MKKLLTCLFAMLLLISCTAAAETAYMIVDNPDPADRLNLRAGPTTNSESLGRYMNGVIVEVLSDDGGDWVQVRVGSGAGSRTGYMMRKFLYQPEMNRVVPAMMQVELRVTGQMEMQAMVGYTDAGPVVIAWLTEGLPVTVLGYSDDMAHIQFGGVTGFVDPAAVGLGGGKAVSTELTRAVLSVKGETITLTDQASLSALLAMLTDSQARGYRMAGCPFAAELTLEMADGSTARLQLATDSCCIFRYNDYDYRYAGADNLALFSLFGVTSLW